MPVHTYEEAIQIIFDRLPMFSRIGGAAVKKGLKNITRLCALLDNPQDKIKTIHVAGTNGKGSTSHIIAAALQVAGMKVGLYTSPHLVDMRERVRINGELISEGLLIKFVNLVMPHLADIAPSYFEVLVALAFYSFFEEGVDIAVIETGLGGRLDSTNVITPILSVITSIALDHTDILGDTLAEIAVEKAGIIKPSIPVVIGKTQDETESVFVQKSILSQSSILFADTIYEVLSQGAPIDNGLQPLKIINLAEQTIENVPTDMLGDYQRANIITALGAILMLERNNFPINTTHLLQALPRVKKLTGLKGRWDFVKKNIVLDVGHNPDGITQVLKQLERTSYDKLYIVYGSVKDKDVLASVSLLTTLDASFLLTQAQVPRAMPIQALESYFSDVPNHKIFVEQCVPDAVARAINLLTADDLLLITGSFFVVGEAYQYLEQIG